MKFKQKSEEDKEWEKVVDYAEKVESGVIPVTKEEFSATIQGMAEKIHEKFGTVSNEEYRKIVLGNPDLTLDEIEQKLKEAQKSNLEKQKDIQ